MGEAKDSSVLFSLQSLMELEEKRIDEEVARQARAEAAEAERRRAEQERARDEERLRLRAEEERRRKEQERAREEEARLAALREAAIVKARVETEQRARLDALEAAQRHERELLALREDAGKKRLVRLVYGGAAVLLVGAAGASGLYFGKLRPEAEAREREHAVAIAEQAEATREARAKLDESLAAQRRIEDELRTATDAKRRAELELAHAAEQRRIDDQRRRIGAPTSRPPSGSPTPKRCGDDHDPLNGCL